MRSTYFVATSFLLLLVACFAEAVDNAAGWQQERLSRGVVAVRQSDGGVFISWRLLGGDPAGAAFNIYRSEGSGEEQLVNQQPITGATNLVDSKAAAKGVAYSVRAVVGGEEQPGSEPTKVWEEGFLDIPIQRIEGYRPGDASVGDLDGDGQLEIVLHQVGRGRDNGSAGVTTEPILDAYKLDGTHLWRINLGKNIREGEHYTQFMVYDLDGDGRAEVACKTADGSIDGAGKVIGDADKDWRTLEEGSLRHGRILDGPEYLTVFDGQTGAALTTVDYVPGRDPIDGWGGIGGNAGTDNFGNRCDRFLACVAYLDGERPSLVMCRGVYGRIAMTAWDWRDGKLSERWRFDTGAAYRPHSEHSPFAGMGGHSLSVADVDNDGRDEVVYQAMVVDDDGKGLYSTGLRHGDTMFVTDIDPSRDGLEVFTIQENERFVERFQTPGAAMRDARTGEILWSHSPMVDVTDCMVADIDPRHPGMEAWGGPGGLRTASGEQIGEAPRNRDWSIWWDGDPMRELLSIGRPAWRGRRRRPDNAQNQQRDASQASAQGEQPATEPQRRRRQPRSRSTQITKWDWENKWVETITTLDAVSMSRGPSLQGDLVGDWREELLLVAPEGDALRLCTTTIPTELRLRTLLSDRQYRLGLVWQNVVYNTPCYPSYYIGDGMKPLDAGAE